MPTKHPRVAVTLDAAAFEAVRYLAIASGTSMSKVIADVVEAVAPVLSRTADVVAAARKAQADQRDGLLAAAVQAEARLRPLVLQVGMATEDYLGTVERAASPPLQAKPARGGGAALDPRTSNTGVRSGKGRGTKGRRDVLRKGVR